MRLKSLSMGQPLFYDWIILPHILHLITGLSHYALWHSVLNDPNGSCRSGSPLAPSSFLCISKLDHKAVGAGKGRHARPQLHTILFYLF